MQKISGKFCFYLNKRCFPTIDTVSLSVGIILDSVGLGSEEKEDYGRSMACRKSPEYQVLANYGPQAKLGLPPVFENKVLLKHSHAHSFTYCLWLLACSNDRIAVTETM